MINSVKNFLLKHRYYFLLLLIFFLAEIIVNPFGEFPLNDDWSYSKSVKIFLDTGNIQIGDWAAMSLAAHILWGALFAKIFGFKFFVLRFSTLIISYSTVCILFFVLKKITQTNLTALIASLCLMFNPIFFNLSNTFMTDVGFLFCVLACTACVLKFQESKSPVYFFLFFFFSLWATFTRQLGILLPFCFAISLLLNHHKRWHYFFASIVLSAFIFFLLRLYENYLHHTISPQAAYVYSGSENFFSEDFLNKLKYFSETRYKAILISVVVFAFPFQLLFIRNFFNNKSPIFLSLIFILAILTVYYLFEIGLFPCPCGNIFVNIGIGPETMYEDSVSGYILRSSRTFGITMTLIKCVAAFLFMVLVLNQISFTNKEKLKSFFSNTFIIFLLLFFISYLFSLFVMISFFDRYFLSLIVIAILMYALTLKTEKQNFIFPSLFILGLAWIAIFGTKDYLTVNRSRWKAVEYIEKEKNIPISKINAGFEPNLWDDGKISWYKDYRELASYNYLIQRSPILGFKKIKSFEHHLYFPYQYDRINIFVRDSTKKIK